MPSPPLSRDVFPQGLPDEYAFVTTFRFRKSSRKEDWYLWQVIDPHGIPQVRAARPVGRLLRGPPAGRILPTGMAPPAAFSPGPLSRASESGGLGFGGPGDPQGVSPSRQVQLLLPPGRAPGPLVGTKTSFWGALCLSRGPAHGPRPLSSLSDTAPWGGGGRWPRAGETWVQSSRLPLSRCAPRGRSASESWCSQL